jgi:hypothetical protein
MVGFVEQRQSEITQAEELCIELAVPNQLIRRPWSLCRVSRV